MPPKCLKYQKKKKKAEFKFQTFGFRLIQAELLQTDGLCALFVYLLMEKLQIVSLLRLKYYYHN